MTDLTSVLGTQPALPVSVSLLGPVTVEVGGVAVALGGSKPRSVLALLALDAGSVVPTSQLVELVWGDPEDLERARSTLQVHVSNLRRALAPVAASLGVPGVLEAVRPGYRLVVPPESVDVPRVVGWLEAARRAHAGGQHERAVALTRAAVAAWRGDPLADIADEPWVPARAGWLRSLRTDVDRVLLDAELALGRHAHVLTDLDAMVRRAPYDERLRVLGMLALYRAGRHADSLALAADCRRVLGDDLGLEAGPELRAMEGRVLRHDAGLAWAGAAAPDGSTLLAPAASRAGRTVLVNGDREVVLGEVATIGRQAGCDVVCDDGLVSRRHAELRVQPSGRYVLHDLGSTNGTSVNGHRVTGPVELAPGDEVGVGGQRLVLDVR